jgi:hypothetical protein
MARTRRRDDVQLQADEHRHLEHPRMCMSYLDGYWECTDWDTQYKCSHPRHQTVHGRWKTYRLHSICIKSFSDFRDLRPNLCNSQQVQHPEVPPNYIHDIHNVPPLPPANDRAVKNSAEREETATYCHIRSTWSIERSVISWYSREQASNNAPHLASGLQCRKRYTSTLRLKSQSVPISPYSSDEQHTFGIECLAVHAEYLEDIHTVLGE